MTPVTIDGVEAEIAVDLIVPAGVAPTGGTRGARIPPHGKRAARKTVGLEAALVDNNIMTIAALDPTDTRSREVKVAGVAALLVAKTHKLNDRIESGREARLDDKDASDVLRLMQTERAASAARTLTKLSAHPSAGPPTRAAVELFDELFGVRNGAGVEMASRALRLAMPEERVRAICLAYAEELREHWASG